MMNAVQSEADPQTVSGTPADVERVHLELLRRAGPARRLRAGLNFSRDAIELSRAGVRRRLQGATENEVLLEWVACNYGADLAAAVRERLGRRD